MRSASVWGSRGEFRVHRFQIQAFARTPKIFGVVLCDISETVFLRLVSHRRSFARLCASNVQLSSFIRGLE